MRAAVTERDSSAEPTWDVARLFPVQGNWSEEEYLALETNHLIELSHGNLEVLAMPGQRHQRIVAFLFQLLAAFVAAGSRGEVLISPLPVRLWPGKYREPDIVFMRAENKHRQQEQYWDGADLVVEVVSPDDPNRDWVTKRRNMHRPASRNTGSWTGAAAPSRCCVGRAAPMRCMASLPPARRRRRSCCPVLPWRWKRCLRRPAKPFAR